MLVVAVAACSSSSGRAPTRLDVAAALAADVATIAQDAGDDARYGC